MIDFNKYRKLISFCTTMILVCCFTYVGMNITQEITNKEDDVILTSSNVGEASSTKISWGIKRGENNEQPDVGDVNKNVMEDYNGIYMGNSNSKSVYLTFDNGFEAGYTESILDVLLENEVPAAFFLTGHYINSASDLVERMIEEGHIIGNHTVDHHSMPNISIEKLKSEIMDLHTTVYEKYNYEMTYIRPPKGEYSELTVEFCNSLGYKTVMWSFAYDDWNEDEQGREEYAMNKIMDNMHNGCVLLLHGTSKDNCNILDEVIKRIKDQGYVFKSLDEFSK